VSDGGRGPAALLAALFLAGALGWAALLSADGRLLSGPAAAVEDWPKEFRYAAVLQQAQALLQARAERISDGSTRRRFLSDVPWNRELLQLR